MGPTAWLCLLPAGFSALAASAAGGGGADLTDTATFALPTVIYFFVALGLATLSVFIAHFHKGVSYFWSWLGIAAVGFAIIGFFAGLHATSGMMCTAPVCSDSVARAVDDPYLVHPLGTSPPAITPAQASAETVSIETGAGTAIYFSVVTFTTLGYGDYQPLPRMRLVAAAQALLGYVFLGFVVGAGMDWGNWFRNRHRGPGGIG